MRNLLISAYTEEGALDVIGEVFDLANLPGPASDLQESRAQNAKLRKVAPNESLSDCREQYKKCVIEHFQRIKESNSRLGMPVYYEILWTHFALIKIPHPRLEHLHEITHLGQRNLKIIEEEGSSDKSPLQTLFYPVTSDTIPNIVVLKGPSGIGKTTFSWQIILDWASGELYQEFDLVFYLSCRAINALTGNLSLVELLSRVCQGLASDYLVSVLKDSESHEKLLFIIDGFDELKWTLEEESQICQDPFEETHKDILLQSLLRKRILRPAFLVITTRPVALKKLYSLIRFSQQSVHIQGFTDDHIEHCFNSSFQNTDEANKALGLIKGNANLFTMCYVPIVCWIVCSMLMQEIKNDLSQCRTATSIFLLYLKGLIKKHDKSVHACLKNLCALANEGILSQKTMFEKEDLERHGLSPSDIESTFLQNIFIQDVTTQIYYSFIQLSMQEFLAALHYALPDGSGNRQKKSSLPEICKAFTLSELVEEHPHLTLAVRFLFGLLNEKGTEAFTQSTGCSISLRVGPAMAKWLMGNSPSIWSSEAIYCLYESQNEDFIRSALSVFSSLSMKYSLPDESWIRKSCLRQLLYCFETCKHFQALHFSSVQMDPEDLDMLSVIFNRCQQLRMVCSNQDPLCFDAYRAVLTTNRSLTKLDLQFNNLRDSGVKILCEGLRDPGCTVQELRLSDCSLSPLCCDDLRTILLTSRSLTKLDLSCNNLWDSGIKVLCEALKNPCTLQELSLRACELTCMCCSALCSILSTNTSLRKLDLSYNDLKDSGIELLCEGLSYRGCSLQELSLSNCSLTSLCCDDFRLVLVTNRSLTKLDLSDNIMGDSGLKVLCEGLRDPGCTLQELCINDFTHLHCHDLRSILTTNRFITKLDLSHCKLQDSGVNLLCEGLKDPSCTLQELSLSFCDLTTSCCHGFRSVFITNRCLTKLDLSYNELEDSGFKLLCEGLKNAGCTLRELSLGNCGFTPLCCDDLRSLLTTNRSLTKLDLLFINLEDSGVKVLCEALLDPGCSLQELRFYGCNATTLSLDDIRLAITTNQTLSVLKTSLKVKEMSDSEVERWKGRLAVAMAAVMEGEQDDTVKRILQLTLEIICLLTGKVPPSVSDHVTNKMAPPCSLKPDGSVQQKILDVTKKITEILTGEVT
ncbi:NACHT, LRR and PYD domains-containing protein 12-like [Gastrophryne carolinensis]